MNIEKYRFAIIVLSLVIFCDSNVSIPSDIDIK